MCKLSIQKQDYKYSITKINKVGFLCDSFWKARQYYRFCTNFSEEQIKNKVANLENQFSLVFSLGSPRSFGYTEAFPDGKVNLVRVSHSPKLSTTFRQFDAIPCEAHLLKDYIFWSCKIFLIQRKAFALLNTMPVMHVSLQLKLSFLLMLCKKCAIKNSFQMTTILSTVGIEVWLLWKWSLLYPDCTNFTTQYMYSVQT